MKKKLKFPILFILGLLALSLLNCKDRSSDDSIVGIYIAKEENNDQEILYSITHVKDNIYGIKVDVSFNGSKSQTDYLEGSYNNKERILTTKRSNVILNYKFSQDYGTIKLLGDENELKLERQ